VNGGEIVSARPVEAVFDAVADERTEPRYNPRIGDVRLRTPEPLGVGTRFAAVAGRTPMTIELTRYERPDRLDSRTSMSMMDIEYTLTFVPCPDGTRMRWSFALHLRGPLRLVRPVVEWLGRRQERRNWAALRRFLEAGASSRGE